MRALDAAENLRAGIAELRTNVARQWAIGYEVAGEHDDVGVERVDAADDLAYEVGFRVLVVMDVADLSDAEAVECRGQAAQPDSLLNDFEMMAIPESGVGHESAAGCERGESNELPTRKCAIGGGDGGGHSPLG